MRKELIMVLLGIITTSFLSSFLSIYNMQTSDKVLLDTVVGVVGAGNFSYWQLGHNGPLLIELTSLSGDADLYVSENIRPSYEASKNNFSSITCGPDHVNVPAEFPRPLGIGVFGHWSHQQSEYSIQVFLDLTAATPYPEFDFNTHVEPTEDTETKKVKEKATVQKKMEQDGRPRILLSILSALEMFLDLIAL